MLAAFRAKLFAAIDTAAPPAIDEKSFVRALRDIKYKGGIGKETLSAVTRKMTTHLLRSVRKKLRDVLYARMQPQKEILAQALQDLVVPEHFLYVVAVDRERKLYKIGRTTSAQMRLESLQTACPEVLEYVWKVSFGKNGEACAFWERFWKRHFREWMLSVKGGTELLDCSVIPGLYDFTAADFLERIRVASGGIQRPTISVEELMGMAGASEPREVVRQLKRKLGEITAENTQLAKKQKARDSRDAEEEKQTLKDAANYGRIVAREQGQTAKQIGTKMARGWKINRKVFESFLVGDMYDVTAFLNAAHGRSSRKSRWVDEYGNGSVKILFAKGAGPKRRRWYSNEAQFSEFVSIFMSLSQGRFARHLRQEYVRIGQDVTRSDIETLRCAVGGLQDA